MAYLARCAAKRISHIGTGSKLDTMQTDVMDTDAVTRVERLIRQGPPGARVQTVNVMTDEPGGAYHDFSIQR